MRTTAEAFEKYQQMCHAMQSGVAAEIAQGMAEDTTPKNLRTGVNSAMVDASALAKLLIEKGVISEQEYANALCDGMVEEVKLYERRLSDDLGRDVTLW